MESSDRYEDWQLQSNREPVATILCQVSEKCGSDWKSQLSEAKPVALTNPVMWTMYVPSRFSFKDDKKKDMVATKARQTRGNIHVEVR